jgi:hypothetical protein
MISRSVLDTRYVAIPVSATGTTGLPIDPTGDTVQFAFMPTPPGTSPGNGDWRAGSWASTSSGGYLAQCLVGPANGGVALATGTYQIWLKVTDSPEIPVVTVDYLQVV